METTTCSNCGRDTRREGGKRYGERIEVVVSEMRAMHDSGMTIVDIAKKLGDTDNNIRGLFRRRGIKINKYESRDYYAKFNGVLYTSMHNKGYLCSKLKQLHRSVYEYYTGKTTDGYDVHHIDGDRFNNDILNLVRVTRGEHLLIHRSNRLDVLEAAVATRDLETLEHKAREMKIEYRDKFQEERLRKEKMVAVAGLD